MTENGRSIAVLIPCFNEATTIGKVIDDFHQQLPDAEIYVYDNGSEDDTARIAAEHGATVKFCPRRGKGTVVRKMLVEVPADVYIMVDGDDTYAAKDVHALLEPVLNGSCDLCVGNRLQKAANDSFAPLHLFGNKLIRAMMERFYSAKIDDMLSGYRVMTRTLIENICLVSTGFEIETEINIRATWQGFRIKCVPTEYSSRPSGSLSKIRVLGDGYRILATMLLLLREYQPVTMASIAFFFAALLGAAGIALGLRYDNQYAFVSGISLITCGLVVMCTGVVIHAINMSHRESEEYQRKICRLLRSQAPQR